jgi:hypothetical protein
MKKYIRIEAYARTILDNHEQEIIKIYNIKEIQVVTHYIILSSLGVVRKETSKTIRRMFKVRDRVEKHTVNLICKRFYLKRLKELMNLYKHLQQK